MKITVHAEGTASEIRSKLIEVANHFADGPVAPPSTTSAPPAGKKETAKAATKKEEPKTEPVKEESAPVDIFGGEAEVVPEAPKVTKKQVIDAMTLVASLDKDMSTALKILGTFNAKKLGDVKESDWPACLAACNKALAINK